MKAYDIIGYTADASVFCPVCIKKVYQSEEVDNEGNDIHPIFASDAVDGEVCSECFIEIS